MANVVHAEVYSVADDLGDHRRPGGERLVEPEVVPPAHGDEIAEPHVRHLVQDRLAAAFVQVTGDPGAEDVLLPEGHGASVLHRPGIEFRYEELVVLAERVTHAEGAVEEVETLLRLGEEPFGVQVLSERGPAENAQIDAVVVVTNDVIRPGDQGGDIGAHRLGGGEPVDDRPRRAGLDGGRAPFETTCQSAGAVTVTLNRALRSGWSKQAYSRLASAVSNCEYR